MAWLSIQLLILSQVVIPRSWNPALHWALHWVCSLLKILSLSLCLSPPLMLALSLCLKKKKKKKKKAASEKQKVTHWAIFKFAIHTLVTGFCVQPRILKILFSWLHKVLIKVLFGIHSVVGQLLETVCLVFLSMMTFKKFFGGGAWVTQLNVWLWFWAWSRGPWVWAPCWAVCWQLRAWSLLLILCFSLSLPLPHSSSVSLFLSQKWMC